MDLFLDIPFAVCKARFAADSPRDKSMALVMGSCLLGKDGEIAGSRNPLDLFVWVSAGSAGVC